MTSANSNFCRCVGDLLTPVDLPGLATDWVWVALINMFSGLLCYLAARTATKICTRKA